MKVSAETNLVGGHGSGNLRLGKEVCPCGKRAIAFKLSAWVCEDCDRIEKMYLMKEKETIKHHHDYTTHKGLYIEK